ncbi:hypothetical protein [Frigoribacterium faeni]|uniref:hypothetical protein n=1 Tax=Frigoribacterium faeni TaxID=145483 RepID=UPI00141A67A5|nr:hypothetical protein [Frigoribacterium faeni]NIJ05424.1 hypothetical protein [Frigoribacterium faeni]
MSDGQHRGGGTEPDPLEDDDLELTVTRGRRARRAADAPVDAVAPGGAPRAPHGDPVGAPAGEHPAPAQTAPAATAPAAAPASAAAPVTPPPRPAASYASEAAPSSAASSPAPTPAASVPAPASSLPPAVPSLPAPASSAPLAPTWSSAPTALTASSLGWEPGAPDLGERAGRGPASVPGTAGTAADDGEAVAVPPKRQLGSEIGVLPELEHREEKKRPLWRHPAFIVSGVLTVLAVGVGATLMILSLTSAGAPQVTALTIAAGEGNVRLDWDGPDVPYDLYAVASDGAATDLTQLVRGTEAWIPRAGGLVTDDSCFVVRAAEATAGEPVSLEPADLGDQSAQSVCVADAG